MGEARSYSILFRYVKASIPLNLAIETVAEWGGG